MSSPLPQSFSTLNPNYPPMQHSSQQGYSCMDGFGFYLVWFLIIAVVAWVVLYSLKPDFVLKPDTTLDTGKVLLWAVIIGLIGIFLIWLVRKCNRYHA